MNALLPIFPSDAALVRRALRGDSSGFDRLIERHQRKAYAVARAAGVRRDALDDIVQEALLLAFRDLPSLREPDRFGPWLLQITRNVALKSLRKPSGAAATHFLGALAEESEDTLEREDFREYLWKKVAELPEGVREAVFLYYHDGESVRAVARALGIPVSTVKNRLKKGRDLLRERLWRRLEDCLRDLLPSTREWKRRARRLALLASTTVPATWSLVPRTGVAAAGGAQGSAAAPLATTLTLGIAMTTKKMILSLTIVLLLLGGGITLMTTDPFGAGGERKLADPPGLAAGTAGPEGLALPERPEAPREAAPSVPEAAVSLLEEPIGIHGRVFDPRGSGIAGARVIALDLRRWTALAREWRERSLFRLPLEVDILALRDAYLRLGEGAPRAESGADGAYALRGLAPGDYRLLASHPAWLPSTGTVLAVSPGSAAERDIELAPGAIISGRVVDEEGSPIPAAAVSAELSSLAGARGTERLARLVEAWEEGALLIDLGRAEAAPDGSFRLVSLEPDLHNLTASKRGYLEAQAWQLPAGSTEVTLVLERGGAIAGRVVGPARRPLAGAEVVVSRRPSAEVHRIFDQRQADVDLMGGGRLREVTGEEGRFRIEGLAPGAYELAVMSEAHPPLFHEVEVAGGLADIGDLALEASRAISGVARSADGSPLAGARVWIPRTQKSATPSNWITASEPPALVESTSDASGRFTLAPLPEGVFTVRAAAEDHAEGEREGVMAGSSEVDVVLGAGLALAGRVLDDVSGVPIPGAEVRVGLRVKRHTDSDAEGRFALGGIPFAALFRGRLHVQATHPDYGAATREVTPFAPAGEPPRVEIRLSRAELVRGRVLEAGGAPVRGARVAFDVVGISAAALGYDPTAGLRAFSGEDGSFTLPAPSSLRSMIGDIRLFVAASHDGHAPGRAGPIALPGSGEPWPEVDLVLPEAAAMEGMVTGVDGRPLAGARLSVRAVEKSGGDGAALYGPERWAYSGADGAFRLRGLASGPSELRARALGHAPKLIEGLELAPGILRLDITLEREAVLEGRVADSAGLPLAGVEVHAFLDGELPGSGSDDLSEFARRMSLWSATGMASARTGADGRWRIASLPEAPLAILARAAGFEPAVASGVLPGRPAPELVLARYSVLRGLVLASDDRRPVARFQVEVINKERREPLRRTSGFSDHRLGSEGELVFKDPFGRFHFDGLRPGEYEIAVLAPGFLPRLQDVALVAGEEVPVEVLLERGGRVEGVVLDEETGAPVAGAVIGYTSPRETLGTAAFRGRFLKDETLSGEDGSFAVDGLPQGSHSFHAFHPLYGGGHGPWLGKGVDVEVSRASVARLEIRLEPAGVLEGRIRGLAAGRRGGRWLQHWIIFSRPGDAAARSPEARAMAALRDRIDVDTDGRFHRAHLLPGTYRLELKRQLQEEGKQVSLGPQGGFSTSKPAGPEESFPLGEVEVRARRTATFEASLPRVAR
jgi:RNA polymerase sigma factor (sigma-70 family)